MSLIGALNVGQSALAASQAAIQVTGNNIANAGNADYTRQTANVSPSADQQIGPGLFIGTGVDLTGVQRQIDDALTGRLNSAIGDNSAASTSSDWLGRIEATFNELGDDDLSTQMSTFFNSFSNLANNPQDAGLRQIVVQDGQSLTDSIKSLRDQLTGLQVDANDQLKDVTTNADSLAQQVADLNGKIITAEGGTGGTANGLRDQRDAVIKQLSQLVNIKTVQDGSIINVYVGSDPLVMNTTNRGLSTTTTTTNGQLTTSVVIKATNGAAQITGGQIGGLLDVCNNQINGVISGVDNLANNLIFSLNKIHASGQGTEGFSTVTATSPVTDATAALNTAASGLKFTPTTGSFVVHVKQKSTGLETSTLVQVDLDGANSNDTTLNSLTADLNGIANVSASISAGKLTIAAGSSDVEISFSQDSSGTLAALGINTFFTGSNARDIGVNQTVVNNTNLLAAAKNGDAGDNQTAVAIAGLESQPLTSLNGTSLKDSYQAIVNQTSVAAASAKTNADATNTVQQTLEAQRESLSGVSLDEEAVNLVKQQRAFQGAARLITVIDEMLQTLMAM